MNNCSEFQMLIEMWVAEEIDAADRKRLMEHTGICPDCRGVVQMHKDLLSAGREDLPVTEHDFEKMRHGVLRSIRLPSSTRFVPAAERGVYARWIARPAVAWLAAAALVAGGFAVGQAWTVRFGDPTAELLRTISRNTSRNKALKDIEDSRFIYSNVSFKDLGNNSLALGFDVTTHVDLTSSREDPLVKELLIQSLLNSPALGARLTAVSYAEQLPDARIEEALVVTMLNDISLPVRLKAQSILTAYKTDARLQAAFLQVLAKEKSVQMRLQALDYLVGNQVDREALRDVVKDFRSPDDTAVLRKAVAYLQ